MTDSQHAGRVASDLAIAVAVVSAVGSAVTGSGEAALRFALVAAVVVVVRAGNVPLPFAAGFGVLLLLATWASVRHWYRDVPQFDLLVHVLTPGSLAAAVYFVLVEHRLLPGPGDREGLRRSAPVLWVVLVGTTAAVVWELYELVVEQVAPSTMRVGYADTVLDLLAGLVGSAVAGWLVLRWTLRQPDEQSRALSRHEEALQ